MYFERTGSVPGSDTLASRIHQKACCLVTPINLLIIAVTCVVSFLAFKRGPLGQRLVLWPPAVTRGHEYWRLLTCGFVHADLQHLLFNMLTLFFFGGWMERFFAATLGSWAYVLFYLGGVVVSILPSYVRHRQDAHYVSLGASGAVSAVLFAFILMQPWSTILVFVIPVPAILFAVVYVGSSIYMGRKGGDHINHSAHLWGAAWGVACSVAIAPGIVPLFFQQLMHPHLF